MTINMIIYFSDSGKFQSGEAMQDFPLFGY